MSCFFVIQRGALSEGPFPSSAILNFAVAGAKPAAKTPAGVTLDEDRVQIGKRGTVTPPAKLRKRYGLDAGDLLTVLDLGGLFVLSPEVSVVCKIAREIERLREEKGLSLEELLEGLDGQRRCL